jgi:hypothetical protein
MGVGVELTGGVELVAVRLGGRRVGGDRYVWRGLGPLAKQLIECARFLRRGRAHG